MNADNLQLLAVLNGVLALIIPLVQQLVTNVQAPPQVKVLMTALLAAVVGFITPFVSGTQSWSDFDWKIALISIGTVFFTSVLSHYSIWKPLTVTGSDGSIAAKYPGGVGQPDSATISSTGYETDPAVDQEPHEDPSTPVDAPVDTPADGVDVPPDAGGE